MAVGRPSTLFALAFLAAPILAAPLELKVVGDHVNLRSRPVGDSEVVGQVSSGETLLAPDGLPEGAEWVKVRPPPSTDLWIFSALVHEGVVTADDTYVRCGPGQHFRPVGKVAKGFRVEPRGSAGGDWLRIAPVPTAELYISSAYVLAVPPAETATETAAADTRVEDRVAEKPEARRATEVAAAPSAPPPPSPPPVAETPKDPVPEPAAPPAPPPPSTLVAKTPQESVPEPIPPPASEAVQRPPELADLTLAPVPRQGENVRFRGRLEKISLARAPGLTRYQLIDKAGYSKSAAICRLIGLRGQWFELAGSEIDVEGRLWTLYGDPVPVLDAIRVRRVASWEK